VFYDDDDDFNDDNPLDDQMILLGFQSADGLIAFVEWLMDTFDDPEDMKAWVEESVLMSLDTGMPVRGKLTKPNDDRHSCSACGASYSTADGLALHRRVAHSEEEKNDEFWQIINRSFKNHKEGPRDNFPGSN
jgi:hypothetical protein